MLTKSSLAKLEPGSAAYVVAHARWSRSRGRGPSMSYLYDKNPKKALTSAQRILGGLDKLQEFEVLLSRLPLITPEQAFEMDEEELQAYICLHIRRIVLECESEPELADRLASELGLRGTVINWSVPNDEASRQARDLVRLLGGLVSKSGAMVMLMAYAPDGTEINM